MLKTWTDTHYQLQDTEWLYIANHDDRAGASLICPGYARDGAGFSIHFTPAHIEILERLLASLRGLPTPQPATETTQNLVEIHPTETGTNGWKYPPTATAPNRHAIR